MGGAETIIFFRVQCSSFRVQRSSDRVQRSSDSGPPPHGGLCLRGCSRGSRRFFFRGLFYIIINFAGSISDASMCRAGRGAQRHVKKPKNVKKPKWGVRESQSRKFKLFECVYFHSNKFNLMVLQCFASSCTVLHWYALSCTDMHCPTLVCTVLHWYALSYTFMHCPTLECTVLYWYALSYTGMHCPTLVCTVLHWYALSYTGMHCPTLVCTVLHLYALSYTSLRCS